MIERQEINWDVVDLLTTLSESMLAISSLALVFVLMCRQTRTAFEVIAFSTVVLSLLHLGWQSYLEGLYSRVDLTQWVRIGFYFGYAFSDFILVIGCSIYCAKKRLVRDKASSIILIAFMFAGILQFVRYIDKFVLEANFLSAFYPTAVPTINAIITVVMLGYALAVGSVSFYHTLKRFKFFQAITRNMIKWFM